MLIKAVQLFSGHNLGTLTAFYHPVIFPAVLMTAIAAISMIGMYSFGPCRDRKMQTVSANQMITFLEAHKAEIEEMYEHKKPLGDWRKLGDGNSKIIIIHPELPNMLVKIPKNIEKVKNYFKTHDEIIQKMRNITARFDRIVLPESYVYQTSKGPIIIEKKLDLDKYNQVPDGPDKQEAMKQFHTFAYEACLCDVEPSIDHNAGFIPAIFPLKIGIFDFDCRYKRFTYDDVAKMITNACF